ncbi:MAG: beta-glucosidase [Firmicutes bacterium]|nr:beta-glucosidase [Bacillota bacterium]
MEVDTLHQLLAAGDKGGYLLNAIRKGDIVAVPAPPVYLDSTRPIEARVEDLLSRMTLEEKIAQLGSIWARSLLVDGGFSPEKASELLKNGIGQITRVAGGSPLCPKEAAELANAIQRFLVENTRLGIPAIVHEECLSGYMATSATVFPQAIGMASTWDPELVQEITTIIRGQMRATGAHHGLAPVLDVVRDPRWGRVEETFGEDPYLVSQLGVAYVKGLQGDRPEAGVVVTLKHFAAHGFSEGGRNCAPVHVSPRELRDTFLFPFEAAVKKTNAGSVMNAYHDIDGIPCVASRELLTDILREEWGFRGVVVSDYWAIKRLQTHHYVASTKMEAAKMAIEAGIDVELPEADYYGEPLLEAVKKGLVSEATIDEAVRRHLRTKFMLGLFENRYVDPDKAASVFDTVEHRQVALRAARESIVLLKNDGCESEGCESDGCENKGSENDGGKNGGGLLPLAKDIKSIAVIGPSAASTRNLLGDYSYTAHLSRDEDSVRVVSVLEGIRNKVSPGTVVRYAMGCDIAGTSTAGFEEAVRAARESDVAVVVVGGRSGLSDSDTCGEGRDRAELGLPGVQEDLVRAVYETGTPVVVVLVNGRPLTIGWIAGNVPAILEAWLPGEEGGNAIADVLFGDYNPAGKLPVSFPREVGQIPVYYNRRPSSWRDYVFTSAKPLFPFGHGLSYTRFEYENLEISPDKVGPAGRITIRFDVRNAGDRKGDEVAQVYVRDVVASISRPVKELKGFKRVSLEPGGKRTLTFVISTDQLAFHDRDMNLVVEPGAFEVIVGSSSEDIRLTGRFEVAGGKREVGGSREFFAQGAC